MSTSVRVELSPGWLSELDLPLNDLLGKLGDEIAEDAKRAVPVRSGDLKDSIKSHVEGNEVVVSADTDYAAYVELGTANQAPQPYLKPALYRQRA